MKVLLVDDNPINRLLPATLMRRKGYEVVECINGIQALEAARSEHFDCVVLDIAMPGLSGIEVCSRLREEIPRSRLRIIAFTAHAKSSDMPAFKTAGFDDLLLKPLDHKALFVALETGWDEQKGWLTTPDDGKGKGSSPAANHRPESD